MGEEELRQCGHGEPVDISKPTPLNLEFLLK